MKLVKSLMDDELSNTNEYKPNVKKKTLETSGTWNTKHNTNEVSITV